MTLSAADAFPLQSSSSLDVDVIALQTAIDAFARYRLLALDRDPATGSPTVEVAHEALLAEWHRLRDWIEQYRDDLAKQSSFLVAVNEWERSGRDAGYLLTGTRLADYERWTQSTHLRLTVTEHDFIAAAVAARRSGGAAHVEREHVQLRLRRRSRRQLLLLFGVVAVFGGVIAYPIVSGDRAQRIDCGRAVRSTGQTAASTSWLRAAWKPRPSSSASRPLCSNRRTQTSRRAPARLRTEAQHLMFARSRHRASCRRSPPNIPISPSLLIDYHTRNQAENVCPSCSPMNKARSSSAPRPAGVGDQKGRLHRRQLTAVHRVVPRRVRAGGRRRRSRCRGCHRLDLSPPIRGMTTSAATRTPTGPRIATTCTTMAWT